METGIRLWSAVCNGVPVAANSGNSPSCDLTECAERDKVPYLAELFSTPEENRRAQ
jgi:hypothetical protein